MVVSNIYGEVRQHEIWKCKCKGGTFYLDALQGCKVVHQNYPKSTPTEELVEKARTLIEQKKNKRKK